MIKDYEHAPILTPPLHTLHAHYALHTLHIHNEYAEFVKVCDGRLTKKGRLSGQPRAGHLAIVTMDSDNDTSHKVLYNKISIPRLRDGEWVELETGRSRITKDDYRNGIPYKVILNIKEWLRDATVVGHNVVSDFNALKLSVHSTAHRVNDTASNESLNALVSSERCKPWSKVSALASSLLGKKIQQTVDQWLH